MADLTVTAGNPIDFTKTIPVVSSSFSFVNTPPYGTAGSDLFGIAYNAIVKSAVNPPYSNLYVYFDKGYKDYQDNPAKYGHSPVSPRVITKDAGYNFTVTLSNIVTHEETTPGNPLLYLVTVTSFDINIKADASTPAGNYYVQAPIVIDTQAGSGFWTSITNTANLTLEVLPPSETGLPPPAPPAPSKSPVCEGTQVTISGYTVDTATSYNIYNAADDSLIGTTTDSTYAITGLTLNQMVQVYVTAVNENGESEASGILSIIACAVDTYPPPPVPHQGMSFACTGVPVSSMDCTV